MFYKGKSSLWVLKSVTPDEIYALFGMSDSVLTVVIPS